MSPTLQFLKLLFTKLGLGISLLFRYWRVGFTLIFVFFVLLHATLLSVQTKSSQPFIDEVGVRFIRIDSHLYNQVQEFNSGGKVIPNSFFQKIDFYLLFFADVWMIYIYVWCIWWIIGSDNSPVANSASHNRNTWLFAIMVFMIIQSLSGLYVYMNQDVTITGSSPLDRVSSLWHEINPVKGVLAFFNDLPYLINPTIEQSGILNIHNSS